MAKSQPSSERDVGAPIPRDAIDPDLVKLQRNRTRIGVLTALGIVVLCGYFLIRLSPDRAFAGESDKPTSVTVADVLAGKIAPERFVEFEAELQLAHAIRTVKAKGDLGLRVVPARGTGERLWLAVAGDGWAKPATNKRFAGRLRKLIDLPFADAVRDYARDNPRPVFATATELAKHLDHVTVVTGDVIEVPDSARVVFDVIAPNEALIVASFTERLPSAQAWADALAREQLPTTLIESKPGDGVVEQARFASKMSVQDTTKKLENAKLWAARVEPVTSHRSTTWREIRLATVGLALPDAQGDLAGIYVAREIPDDTYVLIASEAPEDYWYVMPITVFLAVLGVLFAWALARAVRRDLLPSRH